MSVSSLSRAPFCAAWLDSSIHDFLGELPPSAKSTAFALITCLDSETDVSALLARSPGLHAIGKDAQVVGKGVLVPSRLLREAACRDQLFFGFDEVWFFPQRHITPKPDTWSIVGPKRVDPSAAQVLAPWLEENGCTLGLGDGDGLNILMKAQGLAQRVLAHSLSQPEPHVRPSERVQVDPIETERGARLGI